MATLPVIERSGRGGRLSGPKSIRGDPQSKFVHAVHAVHSVQSLGGAAPGARRAPDAPETLTAKQIRAILRQRRHFPKRRCQCCGRLFKPVGRWNCRCEDCHLLQDDWQPARLAPVGPPQRKRKALSV